MSNKKEQDRKFMIELYPDSTDYNFQEVLEKCQKYPLFSFIEHDKDRKLDEDGFLTDEVKKPHYHVVINTETPRKRSSIANTLGIEERWIEFCRSYKAACQYLIHLNNPEKYQYDPSEVCSNDPRIFEYLAVQHEGTCVREMKNLIDSGMHPFEVWNVCMSDKTMYSHFRRNWGILKEYADYKGITKKKMTNYSVSVNMDMVQQIIDKSKEC